MESAATEQTDDGSHELTVVLADDEEATRAGVRQALESQGIRVVGEAGNADAAIAAALEHRPTVCLLAVNLPGSGITVAEKLSHALPDTKVVMLTGSARDEDLFAALRAGAAGYLLKSTSPERLPKALRGVVSGEAALPRPMTARLIEEFRNRGRRHTLALSVAGHPVELTGREFEVLAQMRKHETTAEIAADLRISEVTVRRHISAIVHKLNVPDRRSALELLEREENQRRKPT